MTNRTGGERLSLLDKPLPDAFDLRVVTIAAGGRRGFDRAEWHDRLVVVERGTVEVECLSGQRRRFGRGAVLTLSGLALRALHNPGDQPALLAGVSRAAASQRRPPVSSHVANVPPDRARKVQDSARGVGQTTADDRRRRTQGPIVDRATDPLRVEGLAPDNATQAGALLAASHADYPSFRHLFPDPERRRRALLPFMTATARDAAAHARAMVAYDDGGILGVALWMPPGAFPLSAARKASMTPALLRTALAAPPAFAAFARVGARLEKAHPERRSWYLLALGVHPRAQRRGVGTRLVTPVLALADDAGLPCYLQTSDPANVDYYQRFGFEVTQPAIPVLPDGPHYIGMTRPRRRPSV